MVITGVRTVGALIAAYLHCSLNDFSRWHEPLVSPKPIVMINGTTTANAMGRVLLGYGPHVSSHVMRRPSCERHAILLHLKHHIAQN